jgi:glutathione peroxidase-family protein
MFAKVGVKQNPHPLYQFLQNQAKAEVGWNFGKFLVKKDGSLQYFSSKVTPESKELTSAIEAALNE